MTTGERASRDASASSFAPPVEALHLDHPLDGGACAAERQRATARPVDRDDADVEARCRPAIQLDFAFAAPLPALDRGVVGVRQPDVTPQLERAIGDEKDVAAGGFDVANFRAASVRGRVQQKRDDFRRHEGQKKCATNGGLDCTKLPPFFSKRSLPVWAGGALFFSHRAPPNRSCRAHAHP
jgi:hypothetical protein